MDICFVSDKLLLLQFIIYVYFLYYFLNFFQHSRNLIEFLWSCCSEFET